MSVLQIVPCLITASVCFLSFYAMVLAAQDSPDQAVLFYMWGPILDGCDGVVARLLKSSSVFGRYFDMLSDAAHFGIPPAFILWTTCLQPLGWLGVVGAACFSCASIVHLARNKSIEETKGGTAMFGFPSVLAAPCVLLPIALERAFGFSPLNPYFTLLVTMAFAALMLCPMVSRRARWYEIAALVPTMGAIYYFINLSAAFVWFCATSFAVEMLFWMRQKRA